MRFRNHQGSQFQQGSRPKVITNRALKHFPQRAVSIVEQIFNAVLPTHHFPTVLKHARVISVLKPGKDSALLSSYRSIILLDTIGKLVAKTLLARILHEIHERRLMEDEYFGFRLRQGTSLELARLVERINRNFGEKRLTGGLPRRGQSLRYRLDRRPPRQASAPKLLVLHSPYKLLIPPGSDDQSAFPDVCHLVEASGLGWIRVD